MRSVRCLSVTIAVRRSTRNPPPADQIHQFAAIFIDRSGARSDICGLGSRMEPKALRKALSCCAALLIAACNPAAIRDNELRVAARNAAEARFANLCGTVTVPERAFLAIQITGNGNNDYVLSFARAVCRKNPALWLGTGGGLFQVWTDQGGTARMILEQTMRGFRQDYKSAILTTDQRGDTCPGSESYEVCRVLYRWDSASGALIIAERQPRPAEPLPVPDTIASREASASDISAPSQPHATPR